MAAIADDRIAGISSGVAVKAPVHTVATSNITLSGLQTINGVTLDGSTLYRVLCVGQTDTTQNGIYDATTGSWSRSSDFDGNRDVVQGTRVLVALPGASNASEYELTSSNPVTFGTSAITFVLRYGANATYDRTSAEIAASVTPTNSFYSPQPYSRANLFRYMSAAQIADVLSAGLTLDVTSAFTNALAANTEVWAPDGAYRCDTSITIPPGKKLILSRGAIIERVVAASATTPLVYVHGNLAEFSGGYVTTLKASPNGIVVLGHTDVNDNSNALRWRFLDCTVTGVDTAGNLGVVVPSAEVTYGSSAANYFGTIQNIHIFGADRGLLLMERANAHMISNINFWDCRTSCLELRGAYANTINNLFFHTGAANGLYSIWLRNKTVSSLETSKNVITNFASETGGAADQTLVIDSNATTNTVIGSDNNAGGFTISNRNNFVALNGIIRCSTQLESDALIADNKLVLENTNTGLRPGFSSSDNTSVTVSADASLTCKNTCSSGIITVRNASDGITAVAMFDSVAGITLLNGGGFLVTADPGSGTSKFYISISVGGSITIKNRYGVAKHMDVRTDAASS